MVEITTQLSSFKNRIGLRIPFLFFVFLVNISFTESEPNYDLYNLSHGIKVNGYGSFESLDLDGDGILDRVEDANMDGDNDPSTNPTDTDGDGIPNYLDLDSDNDGVPDNIESQSINNYVPPSGLDVNNNGLDDAYEGDFGFGIMPIDTERDGIPDYLDSDSDNDGILDKNESSILSTDFDCSTIPELDFSEIPVLESGLALMEGSVYRFKNVFSGLDALVIIEEIVNGEIKILDQNEIDAPFFKPEIFFTTSAQQQRPYVDFRISLVNSSTSNPIVLNELIANFIDVDGNDRYQEYNRFDTPASFTVDEVRDISINNTPRGLLVNGGFKEFDGISNQNPSVNVAVQFVDISTFVFRFGIQTALTTGFTTDVARQAGIQFSCLDNFINPQTTNFSVDLDTDGDGIPNRLDIDSDNDGIPDNVEGQPTLGYIPPSGTDTDGNGLDDAYETSPGSGDGITPQDTDGDGTGDYLDLDSDNDLVPDNNEGNDFNFDGIPDQEVTGNDTDGDGLDDGYEGSDVGDGFDVNDEIDDPANDLPDTDGTEDVNYRDLDDDGDGIPTPEEDADGDGDPTNDDTDGDGTPDFLDPTDDRPDPDSDIDSDNDGLLDTTEDANADGDNDPSTDPTDTDGDGIPDYLDIDSDNDGILDNQEAQGNNFIPPSGMDIDGNGLDDAYETSPGIGEGIVPVNSDNDPNPDHLDIDSDNDGIPDNVEGQPTLGYIPPSGIDTDGNGLDDAYETSPGSGDGITPQDADGDGTGDYLDLDSDNDLVPDNNEGNDFNFDGIPDQEVTGNDTDGDGLDDGYEGSDVGDGFDVNDEIDDPANDLPDTDGTDDVNYRDLDDDGDGIPTPEEDADNDGDPTNDDTDGDGTPDFLDPTDDRPDPEDIVIEVNQLVTPNGDGRNDFLFIRGVQTVPNNSLKIFNRWGVAVYEGEGYNNQNNVFDGRSRGRSTLSVGDYLPSGVYFYIFEYQKDQQNITDSGYIYVSK